jgi:hypothetical protein
MFDTVKSWAQKKGYINFMQTDTSMFWIVNSIIDTMLNFPENIYDIFVANVTHCYEAIPLHDLDNLLDAISFIITIAYKYAALEHPKVCT